MNWVDVISQIITTSLIVLIYDHFFLKKKDRVQLKREQIKDSFNDPATLMVMLDQLKKEDSPEKITKLMVQFNYLVKDICIAINEKIINKSVAEYHYYETIKKIVEEDLIKKMHKAYIEWDFCKSDYQAFYDIYYTHCISNPFLRIKNKICITSRKLWRGF